MRFFLASLLVFGTTTPVLALDSERAKLPPSVDLFALKKIADWDWSNWTEVVADCKIHNSTGQKNLNFKKLNFACKTEKQN